MSEQSRSIIEGESRIVRPFRLAQSLTRLAIGAALETADGVSRALESYEREIVDREGPTAEAPIDPDESSADRLRYLLIGGVFDGQRRLRRRLRQLSELGDQVGQSVAPLTNAISNSWFADVLRGMVFAEVERLIAEGRLEEQTARKLARDGTGSVVDTIVAYLVDNQYVDDLVNSQVTQLTDNKFVDELSDAVVQHFVDQPGPVRKLVQDQSAGLTDELSEEVRERAVTLDMLAETIARRLLGRGVRNRPPAPPPEVSLRARVLHANEEDDETA